MTNILLAISGLSPQVITETLFCLHQEKLNINEIHVITTASGREKINAQLLAPNGGRYFKYLREYNIDPASINFTHQNIHVITDENGVEIEDITTDEENEILLKKCLDLTSRFTAQANTRVFFSIAGGRKTMSACLMLAAQMYGRPQDRMYHVLISSEFENNKNFFYPPVQSTPIELTDARGHRYVKETAYAALTLVPIPFISVREHITNSRGAVKTPAQLMKMLVKDKPNLLAVDLQKRTVEYRKTKLEMMPARLALYAFFLSEKLNCSKSAKDCRNCRDCYLDFAQISERQAVINEFYQSMAGKSQQDGVCALEKDSFRVYVSKIKKDIQKMFGLTALATVGIEAVGRKPNTRYGIRIARDRIKIIR